ncbi:MAG: carboxypeptidase-like regulatory domain-containing protein [Bacteroides sp.]|nr:carboxypeptidase-like regulatory domain-containing protein [Bacteroides sp.]
MAKRTNLFPSFTKSREMNFLKIVGASFLLLCTVPQLVVANTNEKAAVTTIQQSKTEKITGVVKDPSGDPLIGVSVVVKGTTNGTITNLDGEFTLTAKKR